MWKFIQNIKARRMNKIVDEVRQELLAEFLLISQDGMEGFVDSRVKGQLQSLAVPEIQYDELAKYVDHSDIAYNMEASDIAEYIDSCDIAEYVDTHDIASNIDADDIAQHFDAYTIAQEIELSDIGEYIDLDSLRNEMQETKDEIISEVTGMIEDAVAEVESSIDDLTVSRG